MWIRGGFRRAVANEASKTARPDATCGFTHGLRSRTSQTGAAADVPRVYRVNALTRALLESCDGSRTVADVAGKLAAEGVSEDAVRAEIGRLARERVLLLLP